MSEYLPQKMEDLRRQQEQQGARLLRIAREASQRHSGAANSVYPVPDKLPDQTKSGYIQIKPKNEITEN